jgi:hypothetical protein
MRRATHVTRAPMQMRGSAERMMDMSMYAV